MPDPFPNAAQRKTRRAALHARLDKLFDDFRESDGGYPDASHEDAAKLRDIFTEIADLCFQRDPDGDQVIGVEAWSRRKGRMESFFFPHDPSDRSLGREPTDLDRITHENQMARTTGFMASVLHRYLDRISFESDIRRDAAMKVVRADEFVENFRETLARDPLAAEKMLNDEMAGRTPLFEKRSPTLNMLREEFGARMNEETRVAAVGIDHVLSMLATAEVTDRGIEQEVANIILPAIERFGRVTFDDQVQRWNALAGERRRARKALTTTA